MRILAVAIVAMHALLGAAQAAAVDAARAKGAGVVGTVSARLGNCVVVVAAKGVALKPGQELVVARPQLLVALAKGRERLDAWGQWQDAGRIRVRILRGARCCIAFVIQETPRTGLEGKPAPNIRPGDLVCLGSMVRQPPKAGGPATR